MNNHIKVFRDSNRVYTPLHSVLSKLPKMILYNNTYSLRHPLGIYNVSKQRFLTSIEELLKTMSELKTYVPVANKRSDLEDNMLNQIIEVYESLMSYIDDCYNILVSFIPKPTFKERSNENIVKRLNKDLYDLFTTQTQKEQEYIKNIVNKYKHNQARLCDVKMTYDQKTWVYGYFIGEVDQYGVFGPSQDIHQGNTAFSLNYTSRYLMYIFLKLQQVLSDVISIKYNIQPSLQDNKENIKLGLFLDLLSLPFDFFIDEYKKNFTIIEINKDTIKLSLQSIEIRAKSIQIRVICSFIGDSVTREFKIPYYQNH